MAEISFRLAGLDVLVRATDTAALAALPPIYERFAIPGTGHGAVHSTGHGAVHGLIVDIERGPELEGREPGAGHPAFARRRDGDVLVVERSDAVGRIEVASLPVRARFRISGDPYALEACVRVALSVALPRHEALILHSSAVRWHGRARVFSGVSGAGKSTIAALLSTTVPGCERLSDELLVCAREDEGWRLHVPPFLGIAGLPLGDSAPLESIDLLVQAPSHRRTQLAHGDALRELMRHVVVYAAEPITTEHVLALAGRLIREIPCYRLEFRDDPSVGAVLGIT